MMTSPSSIDDLQVVSLQKAAALLDVHPETIGRMIRADGTLKAAKVKGNIRVYLWSIDQYLKNNEIKPKAQQLEEQLHHPRRATTGADHRAAMRRLEKLGIVNDSMAR